jgi:hypothetical protein
LLAVALANLCFASAWQRRIYGVPFFMPLWSWTDLMALIANVLALAGCFYLLLGLAERHKVRGYSWSGLIYCIPLFAIMNLVRRGEFAFHHDKTTVLIMGAIFLLIALSLIFGQKKVLRPAEYVLMGVAIAFPLNIWEMAKKIPAQGTAPRLVAKSPAKAGAHPRVVWIVFDEMDYGLSFPRRPASIPIPQFERLRSESLFATAAHQPAKYTEAAMPALILGRKVYTPEVAGRQTLRVEFSSGGPKQDWASAANVFADARAAGLNVGLVGWYLPYCRIFYSVLSECHWESIYSSVSDHPSFANSIVDQWDALTLVESRMRGIQRLNRMITSAKAMLADPDLSLILIHLPVPHGPPLYDRTRQESTPFDLRKDWFFDNLLLSDRVLGEIRSYMEASHHWDDTTVIVTSDHSLREYMMAHPDPAPLVPFLVKMPGQTKGTVFDTPIDTVVTRQLIGSLLRSEVTSASLPEWLRQHAELTREASAAATP